MKNYRYATNNFSLQTYDQTRITPNKSTKLNNTLREKFVENKREKSGVELSTRYKVRNESIDCKMNSFNQNKVKKNRRKRKKSAKNLAKMNKKKKLTLTITKNRIFEKYARFVSNRIFDLQ